MPRSIRALVSTTRTRGGRWSCVNRHLFTDRTRFENGRIATLHPLPVRGRPHHHQSPNRHQRSTQPYPPHERIERDTNLPGICPAHASEHHVHVLLERSHNS